MWVFFCASVNTLNNNIFEIRCLITFKLSEQCVNINYHWGWALHAIVFWPDEIQILVSIATDTFHKIMIGEKVSKFSPRWWPLIG